jgi:hypothetical protein
MKIIEIDMEFISTKTIQIRKGGFFTSPLLSTWRN